MVATLDNIEELLKDDNKVKIAVLDMDCVLRGKMINKTRFLQTLTNGFGTILDTPRDGSKWYSHTPLCRLLQCIVWMGSPGSHVL